MRVLQLLFTMRQVTVAAGIVSIALLIPVTLTAAQAVPPQTNQPTTLADAGDDLWEERKARAREDVEYLEAFHKAKLAETHAAELRVAASATSKTDLDRQKQKGYTSTFEVKQGELRLSDGQSILELKRVELKDAEIRLARSRRRLKAIERSGAVPDPDPQFLIEDRFRELEIKYELLRSEFDQVKRSVAKP